MKEKTTKARPTAERDKAWESHPVFEKERARARREEADRREREPLRRDSLSLQLAVFALVLLVWGLPIVNPIKLLVVVFHELSHVMAAYATGGVVFGVAIDPGAAGVTLGIGGNEFLVLLAGYVGSLLCGALLYYLSAAWDPREVWLVLGVLSSGSLLFGWLNDFTQTFAIGAAILFALGYFLLGDEAKKFLIRVVATTSCLYPVLDFAAEVIAGGVNGFRVGGRTIGSDVQGLASMTGLPAWGLAAGWSLLGFALVTGLMRSSARMDAEITVKKRFRPRRPLDYHYDSRDPERVVEYTIR